MNYNSVIKSQNKIYKILKSEKMNNRLSHAYLFYGEKGTGKKEMAYILACMLYCENGGCLECDTCKSILAGNHINVNYISVMDNKTQISKEQILDLQEEYSKTSLVDGSRIYIVDGIDLSTNQAQNSLLKFIEDPENKTQTIGVFIATELSNVVSTIQSRCNLCHFSAIPKIDLSEMIMENNITLLDSRLLSLLTNDYDEALEIYNDKAFSDIRDLFIGLISVKNKQEMVKYYLANVDTFSNSENLKKLLCWVIEFLLEANLYNSNNENLILSPLCDKIEEYIKIVKQDVRSRVDSIISLSDKLKSNITPKNVFFELTLKFI